MAESITTSMAEKSPVNSPVNSTAQPTVRKRKSLDFWKAQATAWLFVLPTLIIFAFMILRPIIRTVTFSFQSVGLTGSTKWIGMHNYVRMFGNPLFAVAWQNILVFTLYSLLIGFMVPVILALLINELRGSGRWFRTLLYLPALIPVAVALLVWRQIYAPEGGILNSILMAMGLQPMLWLQNPNLAKPAIVVIMTWLGAGGSVLIYISALQDVSPDIYEAAELDGFTFWRRVRNITLPLLSTRMLIMLLLQIIAVGQLFTEPFILTSGGPANSTLTPVLELYRSAFERSDFGLASAWSVSLLVILGSLSVLYVWLSMWRDASNR